MKATINGITVEGTPQEIMEYQKIQDDLRREGVHIKPPLGRPPDWLQKEVRGIYERYGKKPNVKGCLNPGGCYCTGACMK